VRVCVKCKEDEVMSRIRDAEHSQLLEEMRRRIAELEIEVPSFLQRMCSKQWRRQLWGT